MLIHLLHILNNLEDKCRSDARNLPLGSLKRLPEPVENNPGSLVIRDTRCELSPRKC